MEPKDHFGDAAAEYDALRSTPTEVFSSRGLIWVVGSDAVGFLQGLLSQDVESMKVGSVAGSLLLEPRGKLQAILWLLKGEDRVGIVTERDPTGVAEQLGHYRIRVKADITLDQRRPWELWGPGAADMAGLSDPMRWRDIDTTVVASMPCGTHPRIVVFGDLAVSGLPRAGSLATEAVRIDQGEPRLGVDVDRRTIPHESGLVPDSVSLTKGCYLGQELVARIDSRGRVNRHLRVVDLDRPTAPGSKVWLDGAEVGTLTSATELTSPPLGMGLLHRDAQPGSAVSVESIGGPVPGRVRGGS